jgi:hypothetical protein
VGALAASFAVPRELEARVDALANHVSEVVDEEAREVPRAVGGAQRAEGPGGRVALRAEGFEARALGEKRAARDAQREARVAALKKAKHGLDEGHAGLAVPQEMRDGRGYSVVVVADAHLFGALGEHGEGLAQPVARKHP